MIAALFAARKSFLSLIVVERQSGAVLAWVAYDAGRPGSLSLDGLAPPIALDIHLEDGGVINEPVDGGERHGGIGEDLVPCAEGLVGGDQHGSSLVAGADELEQHACFGLVLGEVGEIIENEQVELVELGERALKGEVPTGLLQRLHEVGGAGEQHPVSVLDEGEPYGGREMALAAARRAEQQQVGAFLQPAVAGGDGQDLGLGGHRHGVELEGVECLSRQ